MARKKSKKNRKSTVQKKSKGLRETSGKSSRSWQSRLVLIAVALLVVIVAGSLIKKRKERADAQVTETVKIEMEKGAIVIEVYPKLMPITSENFLKLVRSGFYDGITWHRVEDWVVQAGDPTGTGRGGSGETIKLETHKDLKNVRGAVAMARSIDRDSATSQFYVLKTDASWLDGDYAVFGKVVSGMDVIDSIEAGDKMLKVTIVPAE